MLSNSFAANPKARYKLHLGGVSACHSVLLDLQAQPFATGFERQLSRALVAVPSRQQIGYVTLHEGAVTRTHETFSIRGWLSRVQGATTVSPGERLAFGACAAAWA
jgi:hypothetical protein